MSTSKPKNISRCDKINYSMVFQPFAFDDKAFDVMTVDEQTDYMLEATLKDTEYREAREWLDQWYPCTQRTLATGRKILLLVGDESYPLEVWSCRKDNYKTICYLEWKNDEN